MDVTAARLADLNAQCVGAGPRTFVLVHGLGGTHANFGAVVPGLAELGRVIAIDLPGFGDSPSRGPSSLGRCQAALARVLDELAGGPLYLIGNSMGGTIALFEAARRADLAGLVLLDPAVPYAGGRLRRGVARASFVALVPWLGPWLVRRWLTNPTRINQQLLTACTVDPTAIPAPVVAANGAALVAWAARPDAARALVSALRSLFGQLSRRRRFRRALAAVTAPTVWLHGEADGLIPLTSARAWARRRPEWTFEVVRCGHVPQLERPELVVERVAALVARGETGGAGRA